MRWYVQNYRRGAYGERRIKRGFLLLPMVVQGHWRWLERAEWVETFVGGEVGWEVTHWVNP